MRKSSSRRTLMSYVLILTAVILTWLALQLFILPYFGFST